MTVCICQKAYFLCTFNGCVLCVLLCTFNGCVLLMADSVEHAILVRCEFKPHSGCGGDLKIKSLKEKDEGCLGGLAD